MYEDKKDTNILLVLFTSIIYVFIAIFVIFFIGLSKVDAKVEITFIDSERMRNGTGTSATNYGTLLSECTNSTYCVIPSTNILTQRIMLANYTRIDSTVADESYLILNGNNYTINYKVLLYKTNGDIIAVKPTMAFMNSSNQWILATCDSGQSYNSTIKSVSNGVGYSHVQTFTYTCNSINSSINGNSVRFGIYSDTTNGAFSGTVGWQIDTRITDNTRIGDDTDKIINNQNQNTQDIINNMNDATDKINQSQQQTNQGLQDIEDALTNSDTSSSNDTIGGFFGSFSDTDHGGLSGIITAPLIAFNQMLIGTCTDLSVEYKGSTTTLPCGTSFWNQISPIRDFLNITLGGLICYQIVRKLFLLIQKIKNPDDDRVEVMSL